MHYWLVRVEWSQTDHDFYVVSAATRAEAERAVRGRYQSAISISAERTVKMF